MGPFEIRTYREGIHAEQGAFFVLSHGNNGGKPRETPWRNCFLLTAAPAEKDAYFWLCYGLFVSRRFRPYLCGSVIPFLHLGDCRSIISSAAVLLDASGKIAQSIDLVKKCYALELQLARQQTTMQALRLSLLRSPGFLTDSDPLFKCSKIQQHDSKTSSFI